MTFREKIADWISGGGLKKARDSRDGWKILYKDKRWDFESCRDASDRGWVEANKAHNVLRDIAAQETPGANATVKRMARIAREGLGE